MESEKQIIKKRTNLTNKMKKVSSIFSEKKTSPKKVEEGEMGMGGFGYGAGDSCGQQPMGGCCGC
jgi:hypothetical protein